MAENAPLRFWVVTDPSADSTIDDICFETDSIGLFRQVDGGLGIAQRPTIHVEHELATADATQRLASARATAAVTRAIAGARSLASAARVQILAADGSVLLDADLV